jgi:hypothetical protein
MINIIEQDGKGHIDVLCKEYKIKKYTINGDGSIDVDGNVNLHTSKQGSIMLNFNKVSGDFICTWSDLSSLEGSPKEVGGDFRCRSNFLTSLEHCPITVGGNFNCVYNKLTSLDYSPKTVGGDFGCRGNKLTSLKGCPVSIGGEFDYSRNQIPVEFFQQYMYLTDDEKHIFLRYQHYYLVWTPALDIDAMNELVAEIKDGLL